MHFKSLNISGVLLNRNQLLEHMKSLSIEHNIKISSDKDTYPIPSLMEDYNFIFETYQILNEHIKLGIKIHSAGEWILDNFYIIEEITKTLKKELTINKYTKMICISNGKYTGFARSYVLATELVSYTDFKLDSSIIYDCLEAYQENKVLTIGEIESFGIFLKIAIIRHIREICEKIYSSQLQRLKVEAIIERIIENKEPEERKFVNNFNSYNNFEKEIKYSFIEYMSYRLKKFGSKANKYQEILENEVSKLGNTVNEIVQKEHIYIASLKNSIGNCIKSLKDIGRINFNELLSDINGTEKILIKDPAKIYAFMDQETKNCYKDNISKMSKKTKMSEIYITEKIVELASRYDLEKNSEKIESLAGVREKTENEPQKLNGEDKINIEKLKTLERVSEKNNIKILKKQKSHVGYYIIGERI